MDVFLTIHYDTNWGDKLYVCGNFHTSESEAKIALDYVSLGQWSTQIKATTSNTIKYKYILHTADGVVVAEPRYRIFNPGNLKKISICDQWLSPDTNTNILYRSLFENAIFSRSYNLKHSIDALKNAVNFAINVPRVKKHEKVAVTGSIPQLGNWDIYSPLVLESSTFALWSGGFEQAPINESFEYKYVIYDTKTKQITQWESGENRIASIKKSETHLLGDADFRFQSPWKGAGIAIPVFSIRTNKGLGIGEFSDLKPLGEWVSKLGMNIIQILPINDTISAFDWTDSYPYNAISIYALNPIYINLDELFKHDKNALLLLEKERSKLNALSEIDFEKVLSLKFQYLKKAYDYHKTSLTEDTEFKTFYNKNEFWLKTYSVFCFLRDTYKTTDFSKWDSFSNYEPSLIESFFAPSHSNFNDVLFYAFIQFHLDKQLNAAVTYLHHLGLALKGDIPIGINRQSVDAWDTAQLFNFDQQTGAPPDYFSSFGQNWGFPTYNWKKMQKNGFKWWMTRFEKMADFFDAYRIDHILGFFRIWEIPNKFNEGLMGHFNPALPYTIEEIRANGIPFDAKWWCTPHIKKHRAEHLFGKFSDKILNHFFDSEDTIYYLKATHFETKHLKEKCFKLDIKDETIISSLRDVICDVLFMPDSKSPELFHPRIEIQNTHKFKKLDSWVQHKLMQLYNDFFFNRHDLFWKEMALQKLPPIINTTNMLVCGEDLGMIPSSVPKVMNKLKILTLDIQTMPKDSRYEFADPRWFNYLSICTTSTHDTPTIRGMWKYDPSKGQRLIQSFSGDHVDFYDDCPAWLCKKILEVNLQAGSVLSILPLQDWLSINKDVRHPDPHAERINKPEFSRHYWRYRMHCSIEELLTNETLNSEIISLIDNSGRNN